MALKEVFHASSNSKPFEWLSFTHLFMLFLFILLTFLLYIFRDSIKMGKKPIARFLLAAVLISSELSLYIWYTIYDIWNLRGTLPLHLCSIALFLSTIMLVTKHYFIFEISYFLSVGGAVQALLTPELFYDFPHFRYFHFFLAHIAIILANLYMIWVEKYQPTFKSVWKAFLALNIIAAIVYMVNVKTGENYMFLARKPNNPSLLDLLGPYPIYLISLEFIALVLFIFLYLPFFARRKNGD